MITLNKIDSGYYEVMHNDQHVGEIYRRKHTSTGNRNYVGYVPAYVEWELWSTDNELLARIDKAKLSDVKQALEELLK